MILESVQQAALVSPYHNVLDGLLESPGKQLEFSNLEMFYKQAWVHCCKQVMDQLNNELSSVCMHVPDHHANEWSESHCHRSFLPRILEIKSHQFFVHEHPMQSQAILWSIAETHQNWTSRQNCARTPLELAQNKRHIYRTCWPRSHHNTTEWYRWAKEVVGAAAGVKKKRECLRPRDGHAPGAG
eukprot:1157604-Pelagomonas_calceolata.AAC.1